MTPVLLHPPFLHCSTARTPTCGRMLSQSTVCAWFGSQGDRTCQHRIILRTLGSQSSAAEVRVSLSSGGKPYTNLPRKLLFTMWKQHCGQEAPGLCPRCCERSTVLWYGAGCHSDFWQLMVKQGSCCQFNSRLPFKSALTKASLY